MKNKSYVEYGTLFNSALYQEICNQIENGTFDAEIGKDSAVLSGKIGQTAWDLDLILNPYNGGTSLHIDSENATPWITTAAGKTFELLPQPDYNGCSVINTDMLGNGGGTFGPYLLDLIEEYNNSLDAA